MIGRRCALVALGGLLILVLSVNIYFIRMIVESSSQKTSSKGMPISQLKSEQEQLISNVEQNLEVPQKSVARDMARKIKKEIQTLPSKYFKQNTSYAIVLERLFVELKVTPNVRENIWNIPNNNWPDAHQLIPPVAPELGTILDTLRKSKVIRADNAPLGTQLKLMLTLEHGVKAMFKPQWYSRDMVIQGPVYHGKDRHNAEVVAFHLSSLLALRRVPITVARKRMSIYVQRSHYMLKLLLKDRRFMKYSINNIFLVDLRKEVRPRATPELYTTMYQDGNDTCLYGVCHYCSPADPVCGTGDILEGALISWLPRYLRLVKHRHPWQRTYKKNKFATWETDSNYCEKVKLSKAYSPQSSSRLLDLVDTAIFDFLMDNGDRHHYELAQNNFHNPAVLLIDNGKSLGNPDVDHFDILAPLYQCCMIHKTTWDRLKLFSGGSLSLAVRKLVAHESAVAGVEHLITDAHLSAMDRRLLTVYAVVEYCLKSKAYASNVILDHR